MITLNNSSSKLRYHFYTENFLLLEQFKLKNYEKTLFLEHRVVALFKCRSDHLKVTLKYLEKCVGWIRLSFDVKKTTRESEMSRGLHQRVYLVLIKNGTHCLEKTRETKVPKAMTEVGIKLAVTVACVSRKFRVSKNYHAFRIDRNFLQDI
ncbi:hypothetical protein RF11_06632 [Thelohanellus kitauei]|uniref:Uncharacterized protein n=1 Tax=Thelohanellus kitauei TaxID=669202 RepID=A0A0C2MCE1_THEKT|nr:hypothetical protein RF11_06632 [Thelohanellus kitauei]